MVEFIFTDEVTTTEHSPIVFHKLPSEENYLLNSKKSRQLLVLSVTDNWNLRCTHCVYHDTRYSQEDWNCNPHMTVEIANIAIDNYLQNSKMVPDR